MKKFHYRLLTEKRDRSLKTWNMTMGIGQVMFCRCCATFRQVCAVPVLRLFTVQSCSHLQCCHTWQYFFGVTLQFSFPSSLLRRNSAFPVFAVHLRSVIWRKQNSEVFTRQCSCPVKKRGADMCEKKQKFLECERSRVFCLLMMSGGIMGAFTYAVRGNVFCNAQTGNILLLGMALGNENWKEAAYLLIPITAYGFGAVVSEILPVSVKKAGLLRWDTLLIGFEMLVTVILGFLPESAPYQISQVAVNFICSMQYNTFRQAEGVPMATTFCTNHLRQAGVYVAKCLQKKDPSYLSRSVRHGEMLLMFVTGAAVGTVLCRFAAGKAVWAASLLLLIVFLDLLHADMTKEKGMLERVPAGH